jgi:RimJ/RimL family protein N-acetyltransferase
MGAGDHLTESIRSVHTNEEVNSLDIGDLSDFFNPFLRYFLRETIRCGGDVQVFGSGREVEGILIRDISEKAASIFARSENVANALFSMHDHISIFSETPVESAVEKEVYNIYVANPVELDPTHKFTNRIRMATEKDLPAIAALVRGIYGVMDGRWFTFAPHGEEKCFVAEIEGTIAGAAWNTTVSGHCRFHALSVSPPYRRMAIGTDLWHARMLWARRSGAMQVLSEISERNLPSMAIAEKGGMKRAGQMFCYHKP